MKITAFLEKLDSLFPKKGNVSDGNVSDEILRFFFCGKTTINPNGIKSSVLVLDHNNARFHDKI